MGVPVRRYDCSAIGTGLQNDVATAEYSGAMGHVA